MFGKQTGIIFYSNRVYLKNFTASLECMGWFLAFDLKKDQQMNQNRVNDEQFNLSPIPKLV